MTKSALLAVTLAALAACGADAPPFQPYGEAGISVGTGGTRTTTTLGTTNGNFTIGATLGSKG